MITLEKNPHFHCPWQRLCTLQSPPSMSCTCAHGPSPCSAHTAEKIANTHCNNDLKQTCSVRLGSARSGSAWHTPGLLSPLTGCWLLP